MRNHTKTFLLVFAAISTIIAPTISSHAEVGMASWNTFCKTELRLYKKKAGWKAFAISNIYLVKKKEWQSCGYSYDYTIKANAAEVALQECREALRKQRAPKSARCNVVLSDK